MEHGIAGRTRRPHTKTRNGCYECKRRHVKCDESQPVCSNCSSVSRRCIYPDRASRPLSQAHSLAYNASLPMPPPTRPSRSLGSARSSSPREAVGAPSSTATYAPVSPIPDPEGGGGSISSSLFTLEHLALWHHIEARMQDWLMIPDELRGFFDSSIEWAVTTPYLANQMLALSALHRSRTEPPGYEARYHRLATQLHARALSCLGLTDNDGHQPETVPRFLFSSMVALYYLAEQLPDHSTGFGPLLDALIEYLNLQRGVQIIGNTGWRAIQQSTLGMTITGLGIPDGFRDADSGDEHATLREKIESSGLGQQEATACLEAIRALEFVQGRTVDTEHSWGPHGPMAWAALLPDDFVQLLRRQIPEALVILAHFAILLHRFRSFWIFGNVGERLIKGISEALGPPWLDWLARPLYAMLNLPEASTTAAR